jgi:hypothetical protein
MYIAPEPTGSHSFGSKPQIEFAENYGLKARDVNSLLAAISFFLATAASLCAMQRNADTRKVARATATDAAIHIDGVLEEPAWQEAPAVTTFLQKDPLEGEPATEPTEIKILYSKKSVFFAIRCKDSEPSRVLATELRRDNEFINDDSISILLDTLHDNRSGYLFRTNPLGTQYDALITDEGRVTDVNWNEKWNSAATVDESGWIAEIEIPFKSLRLTGEKQQVWGMDFERIIRRKSEFIYWSNFKRGFEFIKVSQAGNLIGLEDLDSGLTLRIKPFVKSDLTQASAPPNGTKSNGHSDVGLEDVKYRISPRLHGRLHSKHGFRRGRGGRAGFEPYPLPCLLSRNARILRGRRWNIRLWPRGWGHVGVSTFLQPKHRLVAGSRNHPHSCRRQAYRQSARMDRRVAQCADRTSR